MRILDYLVVDSINLNLESKEKEKVLKELYEGLKNSEAVLDKKKCFEDIIEREKMGSTGVGKGVAIPHAKTTSVSKIIMSIGVAKNPIDYKSMDNEPVKLFFMFLAPQSLAQEYLILLAKISRYIKDDDFRQKIINAKSNEEIVEILESKGN